MKYKQLPSQETLKAKFEYKDGQLLHRNSFHKRFNGKPAGFKHNNGYCQVRVDGVLYGTHRLIWVYHYGDANIRNFEIDHIDRNPSNNRIENLRLADRSLNRCNISAKGYTVRPHNGNSYEAAFKGQYLGCFPTPEEAQHAYQQAHIAHFKEYSPYHPDWQDTIPTAG